MKNKYKLVMSQSPNPKCPKCKHYLKYDFYSNLTNDYYYTCYNCGSKYTLKEKQ